MYKKSLFNHIIQDENVSLAFNSLTCALAEVDESFFDMLKKIDTFNEEEASEEEMLLIDSMKEGRFIVDSALDEVASLEIMSNAVIFGKSNTMGLTIAPTLECNFRCTYCYETRFKGHMNREVQDSIISYIEREIDDYQALSICWYGGEPLLSLDIIKSLSERCIELCRKKNKKYTSFMISNSYLINDSTIKILKECNVDSVQLTIDGSQPVHDARRMLRDKKTGTYNRIVENAMKLIEGGINVSVRINTDKTNVDVVSDVIEVFDVKGIKDKVSLSLARVVAPTDICSDIEKTCLSVSEFTTKEVEFMKELKARGFGKHQHMSYPSIRLNHCCADNLSSFVIDHNGNMYKCYNDIGLTECAVGNICNPLNAIDILGKSSKYVLNLPTKIEECRKCNLLPICMGGCPYNLSKGESNCSGLKYELDNIIREKYAELVTNI